jgi:hypothetical protein
VDKVVLEKAAIEGTSSGALAAIAVAPFLTPDKAAAVGAIVTLLGGAWKAFRAHRKLKQGRKQKRRASDLA